MLMLASELWLYRKEEKKKNREKGAELFCAYAKYLCNLTVCMCPHENLHTA